MIDKIKQKAKKISLFFKQNKELQYKGVLGIFFLMYLFVFISGFSSKPAYDYKVVAEDEKQMLGGIDYTIAERSYDPITKQLRIDLWIDSGNNSKDFFSLEFKGQAVARNDLHKKYPIDFNRIDEHYIVLSIKNISEGFGAIRSDITIVEKEMEGKNKQKINFSFYSDESKIKNSPATFAKEDLQKDSLKFQQHLVSKEIVANQKEIFSNKKNQKKLKSINKKLEVEKEFQIGDDLQSIEDKIQSNLLTVKNYEEKNQELEEKNQILEKKKSLLQDKIFE